LVETVVGMTLLLLVFVVGINLLPSAWKAMATGEQRVYAVTLAQSILEQKRSENFDSLVSGYLPDVDNNGYKFKVYLDVDASKPRLKRLSLTLDWQARGRNQQITRKLSVCKLPR
jgi:hypothetical protein